MISIKERMWEEFAVEYIFPSLSLTLTINRIALRH
jgi:hypothetical protein